MQLSFSSGTNFPRGIAVLEPEPFWVPLLKRRYATEPVEVRGCHDLREARDIFAHANTVAVVIDLGIGPAKCLDGLRTLRQFHVLWPVLLHGSAAEAGLEWVFREAGLTSFHTRLPSVQELVNWVERQWQPEIVPAN